MEFNNGCYIHLYIQRNLLIFWILRALADIHQCTNTKKEVRNTIYTIPTVEVFLESDRKVYLIKRDNKVCYTKVNKANKEVEVYSLSDGELISTLPYDFYTYYTYNQYDIMG